MERDGITLRTRKDQVHLAYNWMFVYGRRGGLMVRALDSGSSGPARHLTLIVPLSTQVYKWVPAT